MREPWKMPHVFTAESGFSSARRLQRLALAQAVPAAHPAGARSPAGGLRAVLFLSGRKPTFG